MPTFRRQRVKDRVTPVEAQSVSTSSATCSIKDGDIPQVQGELGRA
jgi:hypothetical protein